MLKKGCGEGSFMKKSGTRARETSRKEEHSATWLTAMVDVLWGGGVALAAALIVLALEAGLISFGILGEGQMDNAVMAACVLGGLIGGLVAVRRNRSKALLLGIGAGIVLFLLLLTLGMLAYGVPAVDQRGVTLGCACLCGGAIAGILGSASKKKRRK